MADDRELLDRAIRQFPGRPDSFGRLVRRRDRRRRTRRAATIAVALTVAVAGLAFGLKAISGVAPQPNPLTTPKPGPLSVADLRTVQFVDPDTGWALVSNGRAGRVLRTLDGGRTWSDVSPRGLILGPFGGFRGMVGDKLFARDARRAWVAGVTGGRLTVYLTVDGARSWDHATLPVTVGGTECSVMIAFSELRGFLDTTCGDGGLFITSAAGRTWQPVGRVSFVGPITFGPNENQPDVVAGPNDGSVYQAAVGGGIAPSTNLDWTCIFTVQGFGAPDGCSTVQRPPAGISPRTATLSIVPSFSNKVAFAQSSWGALAVIYRQGSRIVDVFSVIRGTTWRSTGEIMGTDAFASTTDAAGTVSLVDIGHWFGAIGADLFRTDDGGRHWTRIPSIPGGHPLWTQFVSPTQGWLITAGPGGSQALYRSADGGAHWTRLTP